MGSTKVITKLVQGSRAVIALVLAIAIGSAPPLTVIAHNPNVLVAREFERHSALGGADLFDQQGDHGHSHDDARPDERRPGHLHGHDPSDHSHEFGQLVLAAPCLSIYPRAPAPPLPMTQQDDGLRTRLERPPRTFS